MIVTEKLAGAVATDRVSTGADETSMIVTNATARMVRCNIMLCLRGERKKELENVICLRRFSFASSRCCGRLPFLLIAHADKANTIHELTRSKTRKSFPQSCKDAKRSATSEAEMNRAALNSRNLLRLRLWADLVGGVKLVAHRWNHVKKSDPYVWQVEQPVLAVLRLVKTKERILGVSRNDDPPLRGFKCGPPPITEVAFELRILPTLSGSRVVESILPNVEPCAAHAVLPDSIWPEAKPANALHILFGKLEVDSDHVHNAVEGVFIFEGHLTIGTNPPAGLTQSSSVTRFHDHVGALLARCKTVKGALSGNVRIMAIVATKGYEARAVTQRNNFSILSDLNQFTSLFDEAK